MKNGAKLRLMAGLVWKVSPGYFFLLLLSALSGSGQILCNVIFPKLLIDELMGARIPERLLLWVAVIAGANALMALLGKTARRGLELRRRTVSYGVERAFAEKIMSVEYRHLEDPHVLDLKERASFVMTNQGAVENLISGLVTVVTQILTVSGLVVVMLQLSWMLVAALMVTVGLSLLVYGGFSGYQQKFFSDLLPVNRILGYYVELAFDEKIHKDSRLYGMSPLLAGAVTEYNREINRWIGVYHKKKGLYMGLFQVIIVLQTALAYGFVGSRTLGGGIGIGDLTMYVSAAVNFSSAVIAMGVSAVTVSQMLGYLTPLGEFMSLPDEAVCTGTRKLDAVGEIVFDHVSFSYPKTEQKVLEDVSFRIRAGEKLSVVGRNGAGKSTVVKLLCRLYRPDGGRITINGVDIFDYEQTSYLHALAAVFQDFRLFDFTIQENVTCRRAGEDTEKAAALLRQVGLEEKLATLPNGMASRFGKEYDEAGVEFSGGQAQKVAIARALYKDASLVILDEPTSALDPLAEAEIYESFNRLVGDKTAVFISHRMSSSVFCDRILVLNGGRVEACGTHEALMARKEGLYYRLFTSQAENYQME